MNIILDSVKAFLYESGGSGGSQCNHPDVHRCATRPPLAVDVTRPSLDTHIPYCRFYVASRAPLMELHCSELRDADSAYC